MFVNFECPPSKYMHFTILNYSTAIYNYGLFIFKSRSKVKVNDFGIHVYCLKVFSRCICSRVSLFSLLLYIAAPPTFYQISMNNGLFQKTKVEFHD